MAFNPSFPGTGTPPTPSPVLANHPFFPDLDLGDFRAAMRVDNVATEERARHALHSAMLEANSRLARYLTTQQAQGYATLAECPVRFGHPAGANAILYKRGVYALAKATLVERYRDYDSTAKAQGRADQLEENIDELRRDAAWAISDLQGRPRATVGLI